MTKQEFAEQFSQYAINAGQKFGILPELILAVSGYESGWATSYSSKNDNNFFGLSASTFYTKDYWNGTSKRRTSDDAGYYRVYSSVQNSFYDFAWLLSNSNRYAKVKANFKNINGFATAFVASGYFTGNKTTYYNAIISNAAFMQPFVKQANGKTTATNYFLIIIIVAITFLTLKYYHGKR